MKTFCLLFILTGSAFFVQGQTPITLGNTNMPGSGDTLRYTNVQPGSLGSYTQTGVNFNWDFSNVTSTTEGVRSFKSGLLTPYAIFFYSLNDYGEKLADTIGTGPVVITRYYDFYKKQSAPNAFIADGAGVTFSSIPLPSYYSDKDELYNFPMTYPKYDSTTFKFSTLSTTLIPVRYSKTGYRVTVVDGWGTVTTPYGTQSCLRLITTQYGYDSLNTTLGTFTVPLGFPDVQRSYQWMTTSSKIPFMEITGSLVGGNFTVTQARYRGFQTQSNPTTGINGHSGNAAISFYPNPVNDRLWLNTGNADKWRFELFDAQGKSLGVKTISPAGSFIEMSGLEAGIYFIKGMQNDQQACFKFIKQ